MKMITCFLDYDGTLHAWPVRRPFEHADALAKVLAPFSVDIVLTTSWVLKYGLQNASAHLPESLQACVAGSIYEGMGDHLISRLTRAEVIERYLARPRWPKLTRWVVLDDAAGAFKREEHVIRCDAKTGLTSADLDRLAALLRNLQR